jgi:hypothetical protein
VLFGFLVIADLGKDGRGEAHNRGLVRNERGDPRPAFYLLVEPLKTKEVIHLLRVRQQLAKFDLFVLDELGYVPASKTGAALLFDVIATAYERNSLIVTTNLTFENWTEALGSERLTGAVLDRLTHRCHIPEPKGENYRLQAAKRRRND